MDKSAAEINDLRWSWLYTTSGAAALIAGIFFLTAVIDLLISGLLPGSINRWLAPFQDNWLAVIFKLHAGFNGVQSDLLYGLNPVDIVIMALVATIYLGLYMALRRTRKIWSIIALAQPFLGLVLFLATKTAGRSGVMGAGLVISLVMLRSRGHLFGKLTAYMGVLASVLLLVGDFSIGMARSNIIAALTGIGYVLLMTWFFLIARRLFQLGRLAGTMLPRLSDGGPAL